MPLYRFEYSGNIERDTVELEFPHHEAARFDAVLAATEAMMEGLHAGLKEAEWVVRVYDPAGTLVATVAFADVVAG